MTQSPAHKRGGCDEGRLATMVATSTPVDILSGPYSAGTTGSEEFTMMAAATQSMDSDALSNSGMQPTAADAVVSRRG